MKNFINKLIRRLVSQQTGDVANLRKGTLSNLHCGSTIVSRSINNSKDLSATPKAVLKRAVASGEFNGKPLFVPDVAKFDLLLNGNNPSLLGEGVNARLGSIKKIETNRNRRINRYLTIEYLRLLKNRNDTRAFAKITQMLISRSNSYAVAVLLSINKNCYRE